MSFISRRDVVRGLASVPVLAQMPMVLANNTDFQHGVASGDPDQQSIVLWTRVTTLAAEVPVQWELSEDPAFKAIVARGEVVTNHYRDHTVKVLVKDLKPGKHYWYRFQADGQLSPIGRTKTLPTGSVDKVGIALVSCSNFAFGYFNAYAAIAESDAVDVVLHTGDYLYEYGADGWGAETAKTLNREHLPRHEIVSLADYRQRHAQYKTDIGSQAMHANHPLIALWDDHESANNPWVGGAQNHQPDSEGDWRARRSAAVQAYYEWMPVREPGLTQSAIEFWRRYDFGGLATLVTMESRHTARARQIEYSVDVMRTVQSLDDAREFEQNTINQPDRRMLSESMETFLEEALTDSVAHQRPWRVLGNAIPMAKVRTPNLTQAGISMPKGTPEGYPDFVWKGQYDLPIYLDTWDGYAWARNRFYERCANLGVRDLLVLTGDSHSFWANSLYNDDGQPMGVEIGTAGVSSPGDFVGQGFDNSTAEVLDRLLEKHNPEVRWTDNLHQGYVLVTLTAEQATVDYMAVTTVLSQDFSVEKIRQEVVVPQNGSLTFKPSNRR